jgi:hypothetical protein
MQRREKNARRRVLVLLLLLPSVSMPSSAEPVRYDRSSLLCAAYSNGGVRKSIGVEGLDVGMRFLTILTACSSSYASCCFLTAPDTACQPSIMPLRPPARPPPAAGAVLAFASGSLIGWTQTAAEGVLGVEWVDGGASVPQLKLSELLCGRREGEDLRETAKGAEEQLEELVRRSEELQWGESAVLEYYRRDSTGERRKESAEVLVASSSAPSAGEKNDPVYSILFLRPDTSSSTITASLRTRRDSPPLSVSVTHADATPSSHFSSPSLDAPAGTVPSAPHSPSTVTATLPSSQPVYPSISSPSPPSDSGITSPTPNELYSSALRAGALVREREEVNIPSSGPSSSKRRQRPATGDSRSAQPVPSAVTEVLYSITGSIRPHEPGVPPSVPSSSPSVASSSIPATPTSSTFPSNTPSTPQPAVTSTPKKPSPLKPKADDASDTLSLMAHVHNSAGAHRCVLLFPPYRTNLTVSRRAVTYSPQTRRKLEVRRW